MINIDKIQQKLKELKRENQKSGNTQDWLWRPAVGEYSVRLLPWQDDPSDPVKCFYFYFGIEKYGLLAPYQFDKPDPIKEFQKKLYQEGSEKSKDLAKKLYAKPQGYAPVIVRGEEDKGARVWRFSPQTYERILSFFMKKGIKPINDPKNGRDLSVVLEKDPKKRYPTTTVDLEFDSTPLSEDAKQATEWMESIPNLSEKFEEKSYEELKSLLDKWLNPPETSENEGESASEPVAPKKETKRGTFVDEASVDFDEAFKQLEDDLEDDEDDK